jgi:hypothetical protein
VGVERSITFAYVRSIALRISRGDLLSLSIRITSRVTPRQIPQVGAMLSKTTLPAGVTCLMLQSRWCRWPASWPHPQKHGM